MKQHKHHDEIVITIRIGEHEDEPEDECGGGPGPGVDGEPGPIATPFLVIPSAAGDRGQRPIPVSQATANHSIRIMLADPDSTPPPGWTGYYFELSCTVANLGSVPSAGLAEFYVGDQFSYWSPGHEGLTPAEVQTNAQLVGRASFVAPPGTMITVVCPKHWRVDYPGAVAMGGLVQVSDLITDPLVAPFDAVNDRHVARYDAMFNPAYVA